MPRISLAALVALIVSGATLLFAPTGHAASMAQALLPNFIMRAQTTISVTVVLNDGRTILVPVDLEFTTRHEEKGGFLSLSARVEQQPDLIIVVEESSVISASMQAIVYSIAQPAAPVVVVAPTPTPAPLVVVLTPTPQPAPVATSTSIPAPPPTFTPLPAQATQAPAVTDGAFRIGDDVMTGDIKWRVISADDLGNTLVSDNQFVEDATTGGRFIRVVVEIDNRGTDPAAYWAPEMLDSQERTFNEFSGQYSFIPDGFSCVFLTVNPGLSKQCTHIYEVAGDAQGLKIKVTDFGLFFGNEAIIELR